MVLAIQETREAIAWLLNQTPTAVGGTAGFADAALHALEGLLLTIFISVGISVIGAAFLIVAEGPMVLREGDQMTITGNTADIQRLRDQYR